jgi:hypothetical protein
MNFSIKMKILKGALALALFFPLFLFGCLSQIKSGESNNIERDISEIEHIYFHPLIVDTVRAFNRDYSEYINTWFVTLDEYKGFVESLYKRNYVLISLKDIRDGKIIVPEGKRPLLLSVDDLNYYDTMKRYGTAEKLIVNNNRMYSLVNGELYEDAEVVTFIDSFIEKHPDFSLHGAKGIIAVTGYKGILGYKSDEYGQAKTAADYLKARGWEFASHGNAHLAEPKAISEKLENDFEIWEKEVAPIVGETNIHIFPYGQAIPEDSPMVEILQKYGFKYTFGVASETTWVEKQHILFGTRIPIDGQYLMGLTDGSKTSQFCDIDEIRRHDRVFLN